MEALSNAPHTIKKAFLAADIKDGALLRELLAKNKIPVAELARGKGKELFGSDATHQGVIATLDTAALLQDFDSFIEKLDRKKNPAVVVLGEVQDPHNVGAIIRSAAAFGLAGVLIPEHNQAGITGTVVKTSAGMAFRIPLVAIGNVNNTLRVLKDHGFWTYALATEGASNLAAEKFDTPTAFILGNEATGVREKTLEAADVMLRVPMHPRTESLNVAATAAIVFYEWSGKHPEALS